MKSFLRHLIKFFRLERNGRSIEDHLLRLGSFILCITLLFSFVSNYILGLHWLLRVLVGIIFCIYLWIFFDTRKRPVSFFHKAIFYLLATLLFIPFWLVNGGLRGPMPYYFILIMLMGILIGGRKHQVAVALISFGSLFVALALEFLYPGLVIPYKNDQQLTFDLTISLLAVALTCAIVLIAFRLHYLQERLRLVSMSSALNTRNEQLKIATQTALRASRAKTAFLANMSHEIRTPLNSIIGAIDLLRDTPLSPEQMELMKLMDESSRTLHRLLTDVLEISKIEADRISIHPEAVSVDGLANKLRVFTETRINQSGKDIKFKVTVAPDLPKSVWCDPARMGQVLTNLLDNAVKYTEKGTIELMIANAADEDGKRKISFTVTDTGMGMPAEVIEMAKKPFFQLHPQASGGNGGVGLGLAITNSLCKMMQADLKIESSEGKGTSVTVHLPQPVDLGKTSAADKDATVETGLKFSCNALVVEDNRTNQIIFERMLQTMGSSCVLAQNGQEALELLATQKFDVVLMDLNMPVMDGIEATKRIKSDQAKYGTMPVVAITANVMSRDEEECMNAGFDGFLAKPITRKTLYDTLANVLKPIGM
ncbi:MAG: hypothetical protein Kow0075_01650 [Salibacteraceae bacterium]